MKKRWTTPALLGAVAAALLLTPALSSAQVILGVGGLYGRNYGFGGMGGYGGFSGYPGYGVQFPYGSFPAGGSFRGTSPSFSTYSIPNYSALMFTPGVTSGHGSEYASYRGGGMDYVPGAVLRPNFGGLGGPRMRKTMDPAVPVPYESPTATTATPVAATTTTRANVQVRVAAQDAEVYFDGVRTNQTGLVREFVTPPLDAAGTYTVEARWVAQGQPVRARRTITLRPGSNQAVDLTTPAQ